MTYEFKVGDKVYVNGRVDSNDFRNHKGTLRYITDVGSPTHCVEFENRINMGHNCQDKLVSKNGYFVYERNLSKKPLKGVKTSKSHPQLHPLPWLKQKFGKPVPKDFCKVLASL